jgi:quercetin dioxygenase-like cupin family protein
MTASAAKGPDRKVALMETISGCTVMRPSEASESIRIGPSEISGAFVVEVGMFPPGQAGPPLHRHPHTDEMFYIADGDATFHLGDSELQLSTGGLVIVPRGIAHTVWNSGDRPVRGLLVISPGDVEHQFVAVETG